MTLTGPAIQVVNMVNDLAAMLAPGRSFGAPTHGVKRRFFKAKIGGRFSRCKIRRSLRLIDCGLHLFPQNTQLNFEFGAGIYQFRWGNAGGISGNSRDTESQRLNTVFIW